RIDPRNESARKNHVAEPRAQLVAQDSPLLYEPDTCTFSRDQICDWCSDGADRLRALCSGRQGGALPHIPKGDAPVRSRVPWSSGPARGRSWLRWPRCTSTRLLGRESLG